MIYESSVVFSIDNLLYMMTERPLTYLDSRTIALNMSMTKYVRYRNSKLRVWIFSLWIKSYMRWDEMRWEETRRDETRREETRQDKQDKTRFILSRTKYKQITLAGGFQATLWGWQMVWYRRNDDKSSLKHTCNSTHLCWIKQSKKERGCRASNTLYK